MQNTNRKTFSTIFKQDGLVAAVATVRSATVLPVKPTATLQFSGYEWNVRTTMSSRNGPSHNYDPANTKVDSAGTLHLLLTRKQGHWTCSEVILAKSLGYGTYLFTVRDVSQFEPATVFNVFTWDDHLEGNHRREMDVEISRWGDHDQENARYVVQPFYVPANNFRFTAPPGQLTHSLH